MWRKLLIAAFLLLAGTAAVPADEQANDAPARKPFVAPVVDDPAATMEANMKAQWSTPERKKWRIEYRPITGMTSRSSWHIVGTHWWVRLHPEVYKLDDLDKQSTYEIDAVALNQNYGVIDFYIYGRPKLVAK